MAQPSTYLDDVRMSAVSVAVILRDIGAPQERFNTPPYMSRRFADLLIRVHSLEQLAVLVAQHPRDAAAFVMTALHESETWKRGSGYFSVHWTPVRLLPRDTL